MKGPIKINFSYNWNNKLDCKAFTTIRVFNPLIHEPGQQVLVMFNDKFKFAAEIIEVKKFKIKDTSEFVARLDTGYTKEICIDIISKMYKNRNPDELMFALILLARKS